MKNAIDLLASGLFVQGLIVESNRVLDARIVDTHGKTTAELQREAQSVGLILKTNGRRTVMANRKLNGFAPVRTSHKTEPEAA